MEHSSETFKWYRPDYSRLPIIGSTEPNELIYELPFVDYLGDTSAISSSGLRKLLKSPRHYIADAMGFLKEEEEDKEKDHFRFGRAAHMMVLEPAKFRQLHVVAPEFTGFTKQGKVSKTSKDALLKKKEWWSNIDRDATVLTQSEMDDLSYMVDSLMEHDQAANLLKNGRPEVTGKFTHEETGVRCRIRPDYITWDKDGKLYVSDLKTTRDIREGLFASDMAKHKYVLQLAFYSYGVALITGKQVESVCIIAMEKKRPYGVAVYWLTDEDLEIGKQWFEFALRTYKRCVEMQKWPAAQGSGQIINLPSYARNEPFPQFDFGV